MYYYIIYVLHYTTYTHQTTMAMMHIRHRIRVFSKSSKKNFFFFENTPYNVIHFTLYMCSRTSKNVQQQREKKEDKNSFVQQFNPTLIQV